MRRLTSPVLEGAVKCAHLRKPQQESDFADSKPTFNQVTHCEFVTHFGQNLAKIRPFLFQPAMQSPGAHTESGRELRKFRLAVREFLREEAAHRVGSRLGLRQLCKERYHLGFDNRL
jgi:hypothetical protein